MYRISMLAATLLMVSAASCPTHSPRVLADDWGNLEGAWLFRTDPEERGEAEGWHRLDTAGGWRVLTAPGNWEAQGVTDARPGAAPKPKGNLPWTDYDGVAWYRLVFTVPAGWRGKDLVLNLGSVDDEDRTFFNGELVGSTTGTVPNPVRVTRRYKVPRSLVRHDGPNVLAIRVLDHGGPGGLMGPSLSCLPEDRYSALPQLEAAGPILEDRFANPPAANRILKIIHGWPDDEAAQDDLIRQLIGQGFGGVVCNVSFEDYLRSEQRWRSFIRAVRTAHASGMAMWLYDERGYPSGTAGGLTLQGHPEYQARGLLVADAVSEGGEAELGMPPGRVLLAAAYPERDGIADVKRQVALTVDAAAGVARGKLPPGSWRVVIICDSRLFEGTHAELGLGDKIPYIDLLATEPTARFIQLTHEEYAARLGKDLPRLFDATFTDEPSLMSLFLRPMPWRVLPWSARLPEEFRRRRGYALEARLPDLILEAGPESSRTRHDFWLTVAELVEQHFFGQLQDWGKRRGVPSGGHLIYEENLLHHVGFYGDFFRCIRRLDAPSIDCLTSDPAEVPWHIARMIGSIADLRGLRLRMCETSDFGQVYRPAGDSRPVRQITEAEIRGTINRLLLGGINTITSYYTFQGITSDQLRRLNLHTGRCSALLTGGHQVTPVAMLYPVESVWHRYFPSRHGPTGNPEAARVESVFRQASDALYHAGIDFTYLDTRAILEARLERGQLRLGNMAWPVLILPAVDTLPIAAWRKLERFVRAGGRVIALAAQPLNSATEFPSAEVVAIGKRLAGGGEGPRVQAHANGGAWIALPEGTEPLLPAAVHSVVQLPTHPPSGSPVRVAHRQIEGGHVFLVVNDSARPWRGEVQLAGDGPGKQFDPASGAVTEVGSGKVSVNLEPFGAMLYRYARARSAQIPPLRSGRLPGLAVSQLPPSRAVVGPGEHVRTEFDPASRPWTARGRITRGNVDTHLFVSMQFERPVDLSTVEGWALSLETPRGQSAGCSLLLIVTDADGRQYLADTGRKLSLPGRSDLMVPWSRFQPAGFARTQGGDLDRRRITAISVGWGGYYGAEGETVAFTLHSLGTFSTPAAGTPK